MKWQSVCILLVFLFSFVVTGYAEFVAVSWASPTKVHSIDETDASSLEIGNTGWYELNCLAMDGGGTIYSTGWDNNYDTHQILTVDAVTGQASPVVELDFDDVSFRGLAFGPGNQCYGTTNVNYVAACVLRSVNVVTGQTTVIGPQHDGQIQGLTFGSGGTLYGWHSDPQGTGGGMGLVTLNPADGTLTDVNPDEDSGAPLQTLEFGPGGVLYGAENNDLYTVDTITGEVALVGTGTFRDVRGMVYIPEPATMAICILGGLLIRRKR